MLEIQKFNEDGMQHFYDFIDQTRETEKKGLPSLPFPDFHKDKNLITNLTSIKCKIDEKKLFSNRLEMAHYLFSICPDLKDEYDNLGLWAWLASAFFQQLRAKKTQRQEHFIPDEFKPRTQSNDLGYRHSVRWPLHLLLNYEPEFCAFILKRKKVSQAGNPWEQFCSNKKVLSSKSVQNLFLKLYQDPSNLTAKAGIFDKPSKSPQSTKGKGGGLRLLSVIIPRLKKSFDVEVMKPDQLIKVAGRELLSSKWVKQIP